MNSVTESCVIDFPKTKVFDFLSNMENLPKWSTQFIQKVMLVDGKHKAVTPIGEVFLRYETDKNAGTIDIYAGPTEKQMTCAFLRVVSFSESKSAVTLTFFQYPDVDDSIWQIFCEWIKIEVGNIKKIFS
jgi:hypothetical protein